MRNLGALDVRQSDAVDARIELDLRIGAAFTRFQSLTLNRFADLQGKTISYGARAALQSNGDCRGVEAHCDDLPRTCAGEEVSGPCQFPTLGFVVERYFRVQNFVPEPFWKLQLTATKVRQRCAVYPPLPFCSLAQIFVHRMRFTACVSLQDDITTAFRWQRDRLFDHQLTTILYEKCTEQPQAVVTSLQCKPTSRWCVQHVVCRGKHEDVS